MSNSLACGFMIVLPVLTVWAIKLLAAGLRPIPGDRRSAILGSALLGGVVVGMIGFDLLGGGYFAVGLTWLALICLSILSALWLLWSLPGWRKLAAGVVGLFFPLIVWASVEVSHRGVIELNGIYIHQTAIRCVVLITADTLEQYRSQFGRYPDNLDALYRSELPFQPGSEPCDITNARDWLSHSHEWRWLYQLNETANQYIVGYWTDLHPLKRVLGPWVCLYSSETGTVSCAFNQWGPFPPIGSGAGAEVQPVQPNPRYSFMRPRNNRL